LYGSHEKQHLEWSKLTPRFVILPATLVARSTMAWTRGERIRARSLVAVLMASASLPRLPAATQTVAYLEYLARFLTYRRAHSMRCITDWYGASFSSTWQPRESPLLMNGQYFSFPDDNLHDGIYLMFISFEQCSLDSSRVDTLRV